MPTALQRAMSGKKLTPSQANQAADAAVRALKNAKAAAKKAKERTAGVVADATHDGIVLTTAGASSFAAGYFGEDRLQLGGIDGRIALGGLGLFGAAAMAIGGMSGSRHAMGVATGLAASGLCSAATSAGAKASSSSSAAPTPAPTTAGAPVREILQMTQDPVAPRRRTRGRAMARRS